MTAPNVLPFRHPTGPTKVPGLANWVYEVTPRPGLRTVKPIPRSMQVPGTHAEPETIEVLDWCPLVSARLVTLHDDGTPSGVYYRVSVGQDTGVFSHAQVSSGEIWERLPDAYGTGTRQVRDALASVITGQGARLPRTLAVTRTGWHTGPDGALMYVYPDGRTWPAGEHVELIGAPDRLAAAAAPVAPCDDDTVRTALAEIAAHGGWAPLFGISVAARSLGQSLRPVPAAFVVHGDPNSGKTSTAAAGRSLLLAPDWPPVVTGRMTDTPTDLEMSVDFEADMPTLLDDLALTGASSQLDQRKAIELLERIIRSLGNQERIRGRRNRELTAQPRRYVRSIATLTAQQLPAGMQASLYRRAVVIRIDHGDAAVRWWRDHAARLGPALRTIADRIIARLGSVDDPGALLAAAERAALAVLTPHVDQELPGWVDSTSGMAGVVESAGQMLAGLQLAAEVAGVDPGPVLDYVAGPLARALAVQADGLDDRRRATDDLVTAVADSVRAALLVRRAHVRSHTGDIDPTEGPAGLTPQDLGLRDGGRDGLGAHTWEGAGASFYWLPDQNAVGVRSAALHDVVRAGGDPRAVGYTSDSLVANLGRLGALRPSPERDRAWSVNHRLTGAKKPIRMVYIRPDVLWPDLAPDDPAEEQACSTGPTGSPPPSGILPPLTTPAAGNETPPESSAPDAPPPGQTAPATSPDESNSVTPGVPESAALALGCDPEVIYLGDGRTVDPGSAYSSMPALLDFAARMMPAGGSISIAPEVAARLGYPAKPTNTRPGRAGAGGKQKAGKTAQECQAIADARRAGWECSAAGIGAWTTWHGEQRPAVTVVVPAWLDPRVMRISGETMIDSGDDVIAAVWKLARYRELTGTAWVMTAGTSGAAMIRDEYGRPRAGRRRRTPRLKWDGAGTPAEVIQEHAWRWTRPRAEISEAELAMPSVVGLDAYCAYLGAAGVAELAIDALEPTGLPGAGFDKGRAGYWQVPADWAPADVPPWFPALIGPGPERGTVWRTTPTVALMLQRGMPEDAISDAYLAPIRHGDNGRELTHSTRLLHGSPGWAERLRDAYETIPGDTPDLDDAAVRRAVKATFREGIGMLRRGTPFVHRGDWADTVIATWRSNFLRRIIRVGQETGRWPLRIDYDCVYYAVDVDVTAALTGAGIPDGLPLAEGPPRLGQFTIKNRNVMTMAEFMESVNA